MLAEIITLSPLTFIDSLRQQINLYFPYVAIMIQ